MKRTLPALGLFFLSPLVAEFLLGNIPISKLFALLFLAGIVATTAFGMSSDSFVASPAQFAGVGVAIVVLVALGAWIGGRAPRHTAGTAPKAWLVGLTGLVLTSAFMLVDDLVSNGWLEAGLIAAIQVIGAIVIVRWSRRTGWTQLHSLALAGGALLTYAWHAFPEAPVMDASHTVDLIGNAVFALLAVILLVNATISREKFGDS